MNGIDNYLSFEVKKEIADRYFGFRKIIEEDISAYLKNVLETSQTLETTVGHNLIRIYTLLDKQRLIDAFLRLTGLPERFFVDSYINTLPQKKGIFIQQNFRGITRKGCLHNMFFDAYTNLQGDIIDYRKSFASLMEDQQTICEQINIFYRKNDIETIFHFLRSLDAVSSSPAAGTYSPGLDGNIENKLRIHPPPLVTELLPEIQEIPPEKSIRKSLKALVTEACQHQPSLDLRPFKKSS